MMARFLPRRLLPAAPLPLCSGVWLLVLILALAGGSGCGSLRLGGEDQEVQELHLLVAPGALPSLASPRPTGLVVRVFASSRVRAKGLPIRAGTLEIMAYDGTIPDAASSARPPAQLWVFPAAKLAALAATSSLGTGYELELPWQGPRPTAGRLVIIARLVPPRTGPAIFTAPSVIPNGLK